LAKFKGKAAFEAIRDGLAKNYDVQPTLISE